MSRSVQTDRDYQYVSSIRGLGINTSLFTRQINLNELKPWEFSEPRLCRYITAWGRDSDRRFVWEIYIIGLTLSTIKPLDGFGEWLRPTNLLKVTFVPDSPLYMEDKGTRAKALLIRFDEICIPSSWVSDSFPSLCRFVVLRAISSRSDCFKFFLIPHFLSWRSYCGFLRLI